MIVTCILVQPRCALEEGARVLRQLPQQHAAGRLEGPEVVELQGRRGRRLAPEVHRAAVGHRAVDRLGLRPQRQGLRHEKA